MQSFKSREYVRETFAWMHYYWYLTNDGIEFLRTYLNLPSEIVPATLKKSAKPAGRPMGGPGGDRPRYILLYLSFLFWTLFVFLLNWFFLFSWYVINVSQFFTLGAHLVLMETDRGLVTVKGTVVVLVVVTLVVTKVEPLLISSHPSG